MHLIIPDFFQFSGWGLNKFYELVHTIVYRTIGSKGCDYLRSCNRFGANDGTLFNLKNTIPQMGNLCCDNKRSYFLFLVDFFRPSSKKT